LVTRDQTLTLAYNDLMARTLLSPDGRGNMSASPPPSTLIITYSYGDFTAATPVARSDDPSAKPLNHAGELCAGQQIVAIFSNPFANLEAARAAPLKIENALIIPVPSQESGWLVAVCLFSFMAFFSLARASASGSRFRN